MGKKALITGISGFAGSFLAEYLLEQGFEVFGTYLSQSKLSNLQSIKEKIHLEKIDLMDPASFELLIGKVKPDLAFHLAAFTSPKESFDNPLPVFINNISIQLNLLNAIERKSSKSKILAVSSGDIYGTVDPKDLPINEKTELRPVNPYAVSKIACDFLSLQHFLSYGLNIIRVRPFNHIGPRQSPNFAVASFCKKIAEIEKGKIEPFLTVGNLQAKRDFTDVRDIVRGYALIIDKGENGEVYNIGSGVSRRIEDILNILVSMSDTKIEIKTDPLLLRPSDEPELLCDSSKFVEKTGWKPKIPIEKTLKDTLDYWRGIV